MTTPCHSRKTLRLRVIGVHLNSCKGFHKKKPVCKTLGQPGSVERHRRSPLQAAPAFRLNGPISVCSYVMAQASAWINTIITPISPAVINTRRNSHLHLHTPHAQKTQK